MLIPRDHPISASGSTTCALQRASANTGLAIVGPYSTATSGTANYGGSAGNTSREFLTRLHHYRIRQNGTITRIKLYVANKTDLTAFYFKVWRKNSSGTYDQVGVSENLVSSLTAGQINTVDLATGIKAEEGDFYGYREEWGSNGSLNLFARTNLQNTDPIVYAPNDFLRTYHITNTSPGASGYDWEAQSSDIGYAVPIEMYMTPPVVAFIGSSLTMSAPVHHNYIVSYEPSDGTPQPDNPHKSWPYLVAQRWGFTYQNMGYGSNTSTQMANRFAADIVALSPKYVVIEAGTNDQPNGLSMDTFLANWKSMLDASQTAGIRVVVLLIPPRTSYTNAQHQEREIWNRRLTQLAFGYYPSTVVAIIDLETYLGAFKTGGDTGNLWNIVTTYNYGDNIHFGIVGLREWARAVVDFCYYSKRTL